MTYGMRVEEELINSRFSRQKIIDGTDLRAKHLFDTFTSHGANPKKLAQILVVWDMAMAVLSKDNPKWLELTFSNLLSGYQASVDSKYHDDYKQVATIEELDERLAKRRSAGRFRQSTPIDNNNGV